MLPTDYRTKVLTWLAAYCNSNCVHSQNETFVNTGILAVCLALASAAEPCSVCVQRLLQWLLRLGETVTYENMYASVYFHTHIYIYIRFYKKTYIYRCIVHAAHWLSHNISNVAHCTRKKKSKRGFMQWLRNKGGLHCPGEAVMGQDMHAYVHVYTFICIYMYTSLSR